MKNDLEKIVVIGIFILVAIVIMASCDYSKTKLKVINNYIEKK